MESTFLRPASLHLEKQLGIPLRSRGQGLRIGLPGLAFEGARRRDRQLSEDRLDPVLLSMPVDQGNHHFVLRSSSASADDLGAAGNALYKAEFIERPWPWRSLQELERGTFEWIAWFNSRRLLRPLGHVPPAELERAYHRACQAASGELNPASLGGLAVPPDPPPARTASTVVGVT